MGVGELVQMECVLHGHVAACCIGHTVQRQLGHLETEARLGGNLSRHLKGGIREFCARHDLVDHAELQGLGGLDVLAGEEHFLGSTHADLIDMVEPLHAAHSEAHHRVGKRGVIAGDDQVAWPGQHQTAGDALALHRGDCGFRDVAPALAKAGVDLFFACHLGFGAGTAETAHRAHRAMPAHGCGRISFRQIMAG